MAHFPVPAGAVRTLLPTNKLKPALLMPGTALLSLAAMEYRQIADVAPYNEFAIMVPRSLSAADQHPWATSAFSSLVQAIWPLRSSSTGVHARSV